MQFTLNHQRQAIGQLIQVTVVTTTFDGFMIGDDSLAPGTVQYERGFDGQSAASGASHKLVVTAFDQDNNPESSTKIWTDQV